ncbi:MAG TPA: hypothetical protein VHD36_18355 [Pirellulales bacterium]|nr:hypothetical protein [Pirellulales bacterium]
MIKNEQEFTSDELRQLDLLVDGELGDAERRQLLTALDARPDGWRRCALAFLEAQSWQRGLRGFGSPEKPAEKKSIAVATDATAWPAVQRNQPVIEPRRQGWWNAPSVGLPWAMAATFLVAFGLAWILRAPGAREGMGTSGLQSPQIPTPAGSYLATDRTGSNNASARESLPPDTVRLVMDDGTNGAREVELPIETTSADDAWLTNRQPIVPRELRQALERMGHRVDERRQFLPVQLDDGRQLVVPVDQVEFTPVSAVYQ